LRKRRLWEQSPSVPRVRREQGETCRQKAAQMGLVNLTVERRTKMAKKKAVKKTVKKTKKETKKAEKEMMEK
jgi:hypothetical protein